MKPNFTLHHHLQWLKAIFLFFSFFIIYRTETRGQCWKQVAPGGTHSLALKEDGTLWGWGNINSGELGIGTVTSFPSPQLTPIPAGMGSDWRYISTGANYSLAIKIDGTLWAWGSNNYGQLGIGNNTTQYSPVQVGSASNWAMVWASPEGGTVCNVGLKTDGTLWAWGNNQYGQLGIGNTTQQNTPVQVGTDADWTSASITFNHTFAIKTNGTLWAWGVNNVGQLGIGNTIQQLSPVQVGTDADWASVDAGSNSSAAMKTNGTLWTWGRNSFGELGLGHTTNQSAPVQVGTDADWAMVTVGGAYMLALKTNGTIWAWGYNANGSVGNGTTTATAVPTQVGTDNDWTAVSAGNATSMAIKANKTIWGWGMNTQAQLGINNTTNQTTPVQTGFTSYSPALPALASGGAATLVSACEPDITGYSIFVHPTNTNKKLFAIHPNGNAGSFTVVYDTSRNTNTTPLFKSTFENITSLMGRLVTITYSGTLGAGVRVRYYYSPADSITTINSITNWMAARPGANKAWKWVKFEGDAAAMVAQQTDAGFTGTYSELTPDSSGIENGISFVEFWNLTSFSTFGGMVVATAPPPPPTAQCWKIVAAGNTHTLSIKTDGTLWAWGGNANGQLGMGTTTNQSTPVLVSAATDWASVSAGNSYSLALKTDGTLWAWGANNNGQLGIGNTTQQNSPVQVGTASDWAFIAANALSSHNAAIKTNGTLWTWGNNANGQLGIGSTANQNSPVQVGTDNNWLRVAVGFNHLIALKSNGEIWAWGANNNGQLGIGNTTQQTSPVQTGTANNWAAVGAGGAFNGFSYGIKTDGALWAWGANNNGQLGIGSTTQQTSPVQVGTSNDWSQVRGGNVYVVALKTDGTLWGWGSNNIGQLGIAGTGARTVPVQLSADTWLTATPGITYALYTKADQTLWAAGTNTSGQLGIGNTISQPYPVQLTTSNYLPAVPALGGGSAPLAQATCINTDSKGYYSFLLPSNQARKLFAIHPMGNGGTFTVVYDSSRNTNSTPMVQSNITSVTSLMGRLVTVTYSSAIGTGVRVRFYYSAADSTAASNALDTWISSHPGSIKQWQWIKYEGDAAAMAANQVADGFGSTYARLLPDSSGMENGVRFVEFWNITDFSTFGAVAFANTGNVALPITLGSFDARLMDNCSGVKLNWATVREQNSRDFTIQRSVDGSAWTDIATINAAGNSGLQQAYSYTDNGIKREHTYFYRLRLNDIDGSYKNSRIVTVKLDCGAGKFIIYPNPVNSFVTVQTPAGGAQKVLSVYNNTGQRIEQTNVSPGTVKTISTARWSKGFYMIIITEGGKQVHAEKIMKQ